MDVNVQRVPFSEMLQCLLEFRSIAILAGTFVDENLCQFNVEVGKLAAFVLVETGNTGHIQNAGS